MGGVRSRLLVLPAAVVVALTVAGCTASSSGDTSTPSASTTATTRSPSPTGSPSPTVTGFTSTCDDALSVTAVSTAAGQPIIGRTAFVVGQADPSIGRLAYLNCRYGLPTTTPAAGAPEPQPGVEIGVSLYATAKQAADRVEGTVADYQNSGSRAESVRVGTVNGTVLVGGGPPTLVVAQDTRTVAVSISRTYSTGFAQLVAIAQLALGVS